MIHHRKGVGQVMNSAYCVLFSSLLISLLMAAGCTTSQPSNTTQRNVNASQSNTAVSNAAPKADQKKSGGTIDVTSVPQGARVLLVPSDENFAGEPQSKGLTPATITDLTPGKYTVHLERPGYKFFQREVTVKDGQTVKVSGTLRKQ
jgi:PEGA domain-containing protein